MNAEQPKRTRTQLVLGIAAVILVAALVAAACIWFFSSDEETGESASSPQSAAPSSPSEAPETDAGAAGFGTPTADYLGRAMLTPNNPVGEPRGEVREAPQDVCESTNPAQDVAIEATKPATLWSAEDGPGAISDGAPHDYSQSTQGAALAVWNYYTVMQRNDDAARWIVENRLAIDETERAELLEQSGEATPSDSPIMDQIAPAAYQVKSCSPEYMVIDVARPVTFTETGEKLDPPEYLAVRFGAVWEDGDWKLQMEPMKNSPGTIADVDGWTTWAF